MAYVTKERDVILRQALETLQAKTPITSIGPGAVARALAEAMTVQLADFYSIMDFNTSMGFLSTARGRALELFGVLYNVERQQLTELAAIDASTGSFYFYLDSPHTADITIPQGTRVFTDSSYIGQQFSYITTAPALIAAGRTRVYASLRPEFADSIFTTGSDTLVQHSYTGAPVTVNCTNPKPIAPQVGYESDDNLRIRIIKEVRVQAGGTEEALRFKALGIPGVRDLVIQGASYGLGSVSALVVPEDRASAASVHARVRDALTTVRPAGVRLFVRQPEYIPMNVSATVILRPDVNVAASGSVRRTEVAITRTLNRLLPGSTMVYNRLIQSIFEASDVVNDVSITSMTVAGAEILRRNYTPAPDQQIVAGTITVASA